jgi:hypothetical protein
MGRRELELDVLCAMERLPFVTQCLTQDDPGPDAVRFAIVLRPFTIRHLVEAHYALLAATSHDVTGRVLYVDPDNRTPPMLARMRAVGGSESERALARARADERARDALWMARLEEAAIARSALEEGLRRREEPLVPILASMQSGVFEIVPDPFPSPKVEPYRVLVVDPDPTTAGPLRALPRVEVMVLDEGWTAVEALVAPDSRFDLVLCAVTFSGWSGAKLYRIVAEARAEVAARIVFVADKATVERAPPSSARARVIARPVDPERVVALLERWPRARHSP